MKNQFLLLHFICKNKKKMILNYLHLENSCFHLKKQKQRPALMQLWMQNIVKILMIYKNNKQL